MIIVITFCILILGTFLSKNHHDFYIFGWQSEGSGVRGKQLLEAPAGPRHVEWQTHPDSKHQSKVDHARPH